MIRKHYLWCTTLLCLSYLLLQFLLIPYVMFVSDEFWFAHHIYQYTQHLPYRDFIPYKSTLGYYLLSLPMYLSHDIIKPLFYIKDEIAIINTAAMAVSFIWLKKYFRPEAILSTFVLILSCQLFLIYSVDLRVDMLNAWVAFFSVLLVLGRRYTLGGVGMGLAFLISQKTLWYIVAINGAMCLSGLVTARNWQTLRQITYFNIAAILTVCAYVIFWSELSSFNAVKYSLFSEAIIVAKLSWFSFLRYDAWGNILGHGAVLYFLWPLTALRFFVSPQHDSPLAERIFIFVFATIILLFMTTYKQPFPYNTVLAVPAFILLYADFFTWLLNAKDQGFRRLISARALLWFLSLYSIAIVGVILILGLVYADFLLLIIPFVFYKSILNGSFRNETLNTLLVLTILFTGIIYPLVCFVRTVGLVDNAYQMQTVRLSNDLLDKNDSYVAGVQMLYNKPQTVAGLKNLIGPAIEYLYTQDPKTAIILTPSLDMTPTTVDKILADLKKQPIKLFVRTHRIMLLPRSIQTYIYSQYQHFWGSIYLYAPKIPAGQSQFLLKFNGNYRVESGKNIIVLLDHKTVKNNSVISLKQGMHILAAASDFRLQYIPDKAISLSASHHDEYKDEMLREIVM